MADGLSIRIGGDVNEAIRGLDQVEKRMKSTVAAGQSFGRSIETTSKQLSKLPQASNQATNSLINLGRVVQDAPYGFIGIANNLNPLFEGFGRLKKETGSIGTAFKALGKDLLGAGGISLAFSLVSSGLILFGDRLFGAGKAAKEASDNAKDLKTAIEGIYQAIGREAAQVTSFVAVLKSETETRERKLGAIKELQRIQPEVFANLKLEGDTVAGLDAAYKNYLENLRTVIAVKIKQAQLEQLITKQLQLQGATLTASQKSFADAVNAFQQDQLNRAKGQGAGGAAFIQNLLGKREEREKELKKIQDDIDAAFKDIIGLSKGVDIKITPDKKDTEDELKEYLRNLPKLLPPIPLTFTIDVNRIRATLLGQEFKTFAETVNDRITKEIEKLIVAPVIRLNPQISAFREWQAMMEKAIDNINKAVQDGLSNIASNAIASIAEGIGQAFAGGDLKNAFQGFAAVIADGLQAIGKEIIKIGTVALLAKESIKKLFTNPALAIAAGAALIALGAGLRNALSGNFGGFREAGGTVEAGKAYIVGEKRPEVFVPNVSGRILPNTSAVGSFNGGGSYMTVRVVGSLRGQTINLSNERTIRRNSRLGARA